ncbi:MAG: peptide chain release factor N(5)-glutamine methyltransferase [Planctomycetota bacterium]
MPATGTDWTVKAVLDWTTSHLTKQGFDSPRLDAEVLLAHAKGCRRIDLYASYQERLDDGVRGKMRDLVKRRANAEPVAYLVGHKEFYGLRFAVTPDVLIPRPESELLVQHAVEHVRGLGLEKARVLDLCTGSGCVAVAIAAALPRAEVIATDVSDAALAVASQNAETLGVADRVEFREGDLFGPVADEPPFDVIVSNPPYVPDGDWAGLAPDVREHEPRSALTAGADGLDLVRRIAGDVAGRLVAGGRLLVEIDPPQFPTCESLFSGVGPVNALAEPCGRPRVVSVVTDAP